MLQSTIPLRHTSQLDFLQSGGPFLTVMDTLLRHTASLERPVVQVLSRVVKRVPPGRVLRHLSTQHLKLTILEVLVKVLSLIGPSRVERLVKLLDRLCAYLTRLSQLLIHHLSLSIPLPHVSIGGRSIQPVQLLGRLLTDEHIVLEVSLLDLPVGELHHPSAMLDASLPQASIRRTISPGHLSVSLPLIVLIRSLVHISRLPPEDTLSVFLILQILALILITGLTILVLPPQPSPSLQALLKLADIQRPVDPVIGPLTMRLALMILAHIGVAVSEDVCSVAMLEALLPLALVPVTIGPYVHSIAVSLRVLPLPDVGVTQQALPHTIAVLQPILPLSVIDLAVLPRIDPLPMCAVAFELSDVCVLVRV